MPSGPTSVGRPSLRGGEQLVAVGVVDGAGERSLASRTATLTHHCGIPNRKLTVPSSGSTTQLSPLVPLDVIALLPHEAVVGAAPGEQLADRPLGGEVGLADEVGRACSC